MTVRQHLRFDGDTKARWPQSFGNDAQLDCMRRYDKPAQPFVAQRAGAISRDATAEEGFNGLRLKL